LDGTVGCITEAFCINASLPDVLLCEQRLSEKLPELKKAVAVVNARIFKVVIILFLWVICFIIESAFLRMFHLIREAHRYIVLIPEVKLSVFMAENRKTW